MDIDQQKKFWVGGRLFLATYWETNKGPELGYCKWALYECVPQIDYWIKQLYSPRPVHPCDVRNELANAIHRARNHMIPRIE
jgi:hypothetical protein